MRNHYPIIIATIALLFAVQSPLNATAPQPLIGQSAQWRVIGVPNRKPTKFAITQAGEMRVRSDMSVAFFVRQLQHEQHGKIRGGAPNISWRWRVDGTVTPTDLATRGGDDRPVAIHLFFGQQPQHTSLFAKLFGSFPPHGHALTYVWGGKRPIGSIIDNPYFDKGKIIIVRNAQDKVGRWRAETRNLADDLRRAFGTTQKLGPLTHIAVSGDTDETGSRNSARVAKLQITRRQHQ